MNGVHLVLIIFLSTMLFVVTEGHASKADDNLDLTFSVDSSPYGSSYSEWMGKWWQWHISLPNKVNEQDPKNLSLIHPREAYSPEKCAWNQNNRYVWFLADGRSLGLSDFNNPEIRNCAVPHDKAILVQIYGGGCVFSEGWKTDDELKQCINIGLDSVRFSAKVDGLQVMTSEKRNNFLPAPY